MPSEQATKGNSNASSQSALIPGLLAQGSANIKHVLVYDLLTRFVPDMLGKVGNLVTRRVHERARRMCDDMAKRASATIGGGVPKDKTGSLLLERNFKLMGDNNDMFDAILSLASDLPQARHVKRTEHGIFMVDTKDAIQIQEDVYFVRHSISEKEGDIERMAIEVFSFSMDVVQLRNYLTTVESNFVKNKGNQLGRQIYYFDEIPVIPPMRTVLPSVGDKSGAPARMEPDLTKAPTSLTFSMFPLLTNKTLGNIYGSSVKRATQRVRFFLDNPGWYSRKGVPYTLGILLHGAPGCGKTSFIKGLAKDTSRHVVNIKLSKTTTVTQINNLFYGSRINVVKDGATISHEIPIDRRIIVMEDIDCLSDVVSDRSTAAENDPLTSSGASLNLSVLLNILDGVLETPGRIVVMTSNEPWKLDSALVRPGRIDVSVEFERCSRDDLMDMVSGICEIQWSEEDRKRLSIGLLDRVWTPAEVTKAAFENITDPLAALELFKRPPVDNRGPRDHHRGIENKVRPETTDLNVHENDPVPAKATTCGNVPEYSAIQNNQNNELLITSERKNTHVVTTPTVTEATPAVSEVPPAVSDVPPAVSDVPPVVTDVTPVVTDVTPDVSEVPPAVSDVPPVVTDVTPDVSEVPPAVLDVPPVVTDVTQVTADTTTHSEITPFVEISDVVKDAEVTRSEITVTTHSIYIDPSKKVNYTDVPGSAVDQNKSRFFESQPADLRGYPSLKNPDLKDTNIGGKFHDDNHWLSPIKLNHGSDDGPIGMLSVSLFTSDYAEVTAL